MVVRLLIRDMMEKREIGTNELARKIGITKANISRMRSGNYRSIRFDTLDKICDTLNCEPGDLIKKKDDATS